MKAEQFTIPMQRLEVQWLHRQLISEKRATEAKIKTFTGPLADDKSKELTELQVYDDDLQKFIGVLHDLLEEGNKNRLAIVLMKEELEEALELNPYGTVAIREQLENLPKEEPYRLTFDKDSANFVLQLLNRDIDKYRLHTIPGYEKKPEDDFKDPIRNKTYWIGKAKKAKAILDGMRSKIEKEL